MKKARLARQQQTSSALVITLLGIVLLTIVVVAFMQTSSLSLTTSKSYADLRRANLAAQAGLDTAIAQITLATGTNLAFVTGQTNYPLTNFPLTVIGAGNLTNLDQMMPLVSGPIAYLTNFGVPGFSANFSTYASLRTNSPTQTVDVNVYTNNASSPYPYIQNVSDTNMYRASWVTMTNIVGSQVNYTRFAYVVLDDSARMNPRLMTGAGTGYTNSTNWYTGPQDLNITSLTNAAGAQVLTATQLALVTASSNSFSYSDATLGETFPNRSAYEAVKNYFTSMTNSSFDVIPAWLPNGGMPKYNINDLATNTAYGATALARASNIASIITNNLPIFYQRDPAMTALANQTLYVNRLAANILTYISPDSTWPTSEYAASSSTTPSPAGISPQVKGIFPIRMAEGFYSPTKGQTACQFWLDCWNPYTTSVPITNAVLHVWNQPSFNYASSPATIYPTLPYSNSYSYISEPGKVVGPNEFVTLGFPPVTNTLNASATAYPAMVADANNGLNSAPYEQYSLVINGQTVAQSQNRPNICGLPTGGPNTLSASFLWECMFYYAKPSTQAVGDPRFQNYQYTIWDNTHGNGPPAAYSSLQWNGYPTNNAGGQWLPWTMWQNRDNIVRPTVNPGYSLASVAITPDTLASAYSSNTDAPAAPEVFRNGPMVSIGELGHVFDPAYADDALTANSSTMDGGGYSSVYLIGGGRSLRIGRPEATGATTSAGAATINSWAVNGERAISLLDLFTVNNPNTNTTIGATNSIAASLTSGGAMGRINPNTASTNVLAALFSGIQITSDAGMTNASAQLISPLVLANVASMSSNVVFNRPYSSLSDLYKVMPIFDTANNYYSPSTSGNLTVNSLGYLNVANRVHQEAFGKWIQHLTVQSRSYRIYVIGQVLDSLQNPHGSVAMEAGIYLQYNPSEGKYNPVIEYLHILK